MVFQDVAGRAQADPRRWYKYVSREAATAILTRRTLRWSTPGTLNDPFDNQFDLRIDADYAEVERLALQKLWDTYSGAVNVPMRNQIGVLMVAIGALVPNLRRDEFDAHLADGVRDSLARFEQRFPQFQRELAAANTQSKVLCLSEVRDQMLMWAHYAEQHRGLVLCFRCVPGADSPWPAGRPIDYVEAMPAYFDNDFLSDYLAGRAAMEPLHILRKMVFTKSIDWSYEREWRIWTGNGRNREAAFEDIRFGAQELDAVILGCRMDADDRAQFSALSRRLYPHAEVLQAARRAREFALDIH